MVKHSILVQGVRLSGKTQKPPVILQMHDDDFPGRFLTDLAAPDRPRISKAISVDRVVPPPSSPVPVLFQPVQRMLHLAMVQLSCEGPASPMVDPKRVESAGIVIRRVNGTADGATARDLNSVSAWMRSPEGQCQWVSLNQWQESLDPDPTKRPQLYSGQRELDRQLAAISLSRANAEVSTPAFVAPPETCAALGRTIVYALIPTASSEVSDASPPSPTVSDNSTLADNLPPLLKEGSHSSGSLFPPLPSKIVDYRWMSDEYLQELFLTGPDGKVPDEVRQFQMFTTAVRMLHTVFGAFDSEDNDILKVLNKRHVYIRNLGDGSLATVGMGKFYGSAKTILLDYNAYGTSSQNPPQPPTLTMPEAWDGFSKKDEEDLLDALMAALTPRAKKAAMPVGRFHNRYSQYRLRMFFRIKAETPGCPSELVWSHYSEPFRIAAWFESSDRPHSPIPLPNPSKDFLQNVKPNCSFHVPGALMGAMQGTSMSGLMKGSGGGGALSLDWICGFNIPLITICAFFVLNIFLMLLNIVFFWLPFIKICIPFPFDPGQD